MIPDQAEVWNKKHLKGDHEVLRYTPSPLSMLVEPYFSPGSYILELGCGVGRDANYFSDKGHYVLATDSSSVVIDQNLKSFPDTKVKFSVIDMKSQLPYADNTFDVVYANLSLHYYPDIKTREIIKNISKVLKPNGILAYACKSYDDYRTNGSKEVEPNMFVAQDGHVMHLFTAEYSDSVLNDLFEIVSMDEVDEEYGGRVSGILRCIAKNIKNERNP